MHNLRAIRHRLGVTQQQLADGLGMTQANVSHYEAGQTVPPTVARSVIAFAADRGLTLTYDDVYNTQTSPAAASPAAAPSPAS